jgi:tetratricopeptide (TPR) repeat protein
MVLLLRTSEAGMEYVAKVGHGMRNEDQGRPALPVRLTSSEREFFVALRRLVDASGLSLRRLADMTRVAGLASPESSELSSQAKYTVTQWQNWLNGQSLPPRMAVRMLTDALVIADRDAGNLPELWALAFMPTPYPQEASDAVPRPRHPPRDDPAAAHPAAAYSDAARSDAARTAFSSSYQQLSDSAARVFRLLSVHPGPDVSLPAAASLAGVALAEARSALAELATTDLVEEHLPGRFACHQPQRGYAAEQARKNEPAGEPDRALQRLLDHHLRTMVSAVSLGYPGLSLPVPVPAPLAGVLPEGFESDDQARAWCHAELPVVRSLLIRAAERDLNIYCWQVPSAMAMFLARTDLIDDFLAVQRIALAAAEKLGDPLALGHAHFHFAHACALLGEVKDSDSHLQDALRNFNQADDQTAAAATLNGMAQLFMQQGEYPRALEREEESLRLRLALGDRDAVAHSEETIGSIYSRLGQYDLALRHCYRSLDISRETGARLLAADALTTLGFVWIALGDARRAIASYMEVLAIYRQAGSDLLTVTALTGLGDARQVAGDQDGARASWQQALVLLKDLPNTDDQPVRARLARHHNQGLTRRPPGRVAVEAESRPSRQGGCYRARGGCCHARAAATGSGRRRPHGRPTAGRPRSPIAPAHRGPRRRTRPQTPTAAGTRRHPASRGRTPRKRPSTDPWRRRSPAPARCGR